MSTNLLFWAFNIVSLATLVTLIAMVRKDTTAQVRFLILFGLVAGLGYYFFSERNAFYLRVGAERASQSQRASGPIELAAVWDNRQDGFFRGVELAVEQINGQGGVAQPDGRAARPLKLLKFVERDGDAEDEGVQYQLARREATVAVIGHRNADHAIAASLTYDNNKLLYLASTVSNPRLTEHGFQYVFRSAPDDRHFSGALVDYCRASGARRIAVLYPRTRYGNTFTAMFRDRLRQSNLADKDPERALALAMMKSYAAGEADFSGLVSELMLYRYDAILIADAAPRAGVLIREIRRRGIGQTILGSEAMATPQLWQDAGQLARNVVLASAAPAEPDPAVPGLAAGFARDYQARYGAPPDHWAGQGYESVRILAQAWRRAGTTVPRAVGSVLREYRDWQGLYGVYGFSQDGDVLNHQVYLKTLRDGRFRPLGPIPAPAPL